MPAVYRILDANANRAREALRVMEEAARFLRNDSDLARALKHLRHDLAATLALLPPGLLEAHRDTPGDVGTRLKTPREITRADVGEVVVAAGKRLSEALRVLEEYGKVADAPLRTDLPARIEALRYRGYELERRLQLTLTTGRARQWKLCVLLTADLCPRGDWLKVARTVIATAAAQRAGGDVCLQLREKHLDAGELLRRARQLVEWARPRGVTVIVNDRPDVALAAGADGVHVGQTDLPVAEVRRLVGRQLLVGVSTANLAQARAAVRAGADYCGVGPMFPTTTKLKPVLAGPKYLRQFVRAFPELPHLAIGGITPDNLPALRAVGGRGVAVSSAVCTAADPAQVVRCFLRALG